MTINFELRNRPDKKGLCQLRLVYQENGKRKFEVLPIKIAPRQWNREKQAIDNSHPQAAALNKALQLKMADATTKALNGSVAMQEDLSFKYFAATCLARWEKTKSANTIRAYQSMLRKVIAFDAGVTLQKITPNWLLNFENWCMDNGCNKPGALKRVSFVSTIIHEALRHEKIQHNPFAIYKKPEKINPPKVWLSMEELQRFENIQVESISLKNVASWFLLSCYTGLRFSDVQRFDMQTHIVDGRIILYTTKTGQVVSIKISSRCQQLLQKWPTTKVYTNQKCNQYLKALAVVCNINKLITFHTARHTFAVQCANLGISAEVTSKLLGHSDLKTTAIYYKIVNSRIDAEMDKWG